MAFHSGFILFFFALLLGVGHADAQEGALPPVPALEGDVLPPVHGGMVEEDPSTERGEDGAAFLPPIDELLGESRPQVDLLPQRPFTVHLRLLEKSSNRFSEYNLTAQTQIFHRDLLLEARGCLKDHGDIPGNDVAYLHLADKGGRTVFQGWVYQKMPGVSLLNHPRYHIFVRGCTVG